MEDLRKYIKYYSLENYLFDEVSNSFKTRGYLTAEEFFAIIIWKSNRSKTKLKFLEEGTSISEKIKRLTEKIHNETNDLEKIKILQNKKIVRGIGIPVASAILSVCYPNYFTITDYRAVASLQKLSKKKEIQKTVPTNTPSSAKSYINYVKICQEIAQEKGLTLRELDKALWGMDFYEGEGGLKLLANSLP